MGVVGDSRSGTKAPVAFLDDARKRHERRTQVPNVAEPEDEQPSESGDEDCSGYALGLADSLMSNESEAPAMASADDVLARHERAAESDSPAAVVLEPSKEAAADEILLALEGHHERAEPRERRPAPRGSADLAAHQAQGPGTRATKARTKREPSRRRRRLIGAGALATVVATVAIVVNTTSTATSSRAADHPVSASQNAPVLTLGTIAIPKLTLLAVSHHSAAATRLHRAKRRPATHRAAAHSSAPPPASASPPSSFRTASSSSGRSSALPSGASYSSQPTAVESSSTAASSTRPAGPAGPGSTVGGNCNPKCS